MNGLFLVDKPSGPTSFDVVRHIRRAAKIRKVGHSGTLDPLASGLLVVAVGQGTKLVPYLMDTEKRYVAQITLGTSTDTDDRLGTTIAESPVPALSEKRITEILDQFKGSIKQVPPKFSALKSEGEPLYRKARRGEEVRPKSREVHIDSLALGEVGRNSFVLDVTCGKGTYIRSLARDIAIALGTVGHLAELRRLKTSGFKVEDALSLKEIETLGQEQRLEERIIPLGRALPDMRKIELSAAEQTRIAHGQAIDYPTVLGEKSDHPSTLEKTACLLGPTGTLAAIGKIEGGTVKPVRVFC